MSDVNPTGRETELKLLLPDARAIDLLLLELGPELPALHQRNVYYDGPAGEWSQAGLAVRLRQEGPEHRITVKTAGEIHGDLVARGEFERAIEPELAWRYAPGGPMLQCAVADLLAEHDVELPDQLYASMLAEVGSMDNLRRRAPLPAGTHADLEALVVELDTTTYPNGQIVCEVELEVPDVEGSHDAVQVLRACFERAGLSWRPSTVSKRERLERVLRGEEL